MGWMGPDNHEGWVVPLFADGAEGAGVSSGEGILVTVAGVDEWRPDAAVIGWVPGCECGWRGRPWTRSPSPVLADPAARLLATSGAYADLDEDDEALVIDEWRQHIAPWTAVEEVEEAAAAYAAAARDLDETVRTARRAGASWAAIGRATGMTRQSANERWTARV
jgi:hypothetical protein